jgi:hypothetical protein
MRHSFLILAASTFLAMFAGCACNQCGAPCQNNAGGVSRQPQQAAASNGQGGVVSYPYYTMRGPRDFLETHPQSIGP